MVKESTMKETLEMWIDFWVRKIPWRRKWQTPPVFLSEKYPGQRSLVGGKELYATEHN